MSQDAIHYEMDRDAANAMFPVEDEPVISTMDKPLIIESACYGARLGRSGSKSLEGCAPSWW
jgi:hypothetical protein